MSVERTPMARVRFYAAESSEGLPTTIIGTNEDGALLFNHPSFEEFVEDNGYTVTPLRRGIAPKGGVSEAHVELRPPLSELRMKILGRMCAGSGVEGIFEQCTVFDNTLVLPQQDTFHEIVATTPSSGRILKEAV